MRFRTLLSEWLPCRVIILFVTWMIVTNIFALFAGNRFNLDTDTAYNWIAASDAWETHTWNLLSLHYRWDSVWYIRIAKDGYHFTNGQLSNVAFFPLYPTLIRLGSILTGGNSLLAGWIISSLCLLGALAFLHRLVKEFHPGIDPRAPLIFLLIFPTAFFYNAIYTESLFLLLTVAAFYYALRKQFLAASAIGFFAALTRPTGFILLLPVAWEYLKYRKFSLKELLVPQTLSLLLIPAGITWLFLYHFLRFGDFFLFLKAERAFGYGFQVNTNHILMETSPAIMNFTQDAAFAILGVALGVLVMLRVRTSYGIYVLASMVVIFSGGTLKGVVRYMAVLFPMYILMGSWRSEPLKQGWAYLSILLLAVNIISFVNFYWAG